MATIILISSHNNLILYTDKFYTTITFTFPFIIIIYKCRLSWLNWLWLIDIVVVVCNWTFFINFTWICFKCCHNRHLYNRKINNFILDRNMICLDLGIRRNLRLILCVILSLWWIGKIWGCHFLKDKYVIILNCLRIIIKLVYWFYLYREKYFIWEFLIKDH